MVCRDGYAAAGVSAQLGGQMRDQAIHFFDLLRFLTGDEVTTVAAMGGAGAAGDRRIR